MNILETLKNAFRPQPVGIVMDADLEAANRFWDEARSRVLAIAKAHGLRLELADHDDGFLFDLYDDGENVPSEAEVVEAIQEFLNVVPGEGACSGNCQSCPYLDFDSGFPGETLTYCKRPGHERILDVDFDVSAVI